ncbi:PREDICTED: rust resistance kinase Lr10-like [Nelumbo nucifera]|uniref:Rust resistance kinase Lr10-like n=1 Tax=Nelumbo nucifera TaxID=4432 RepID=A0A1U8AC79_NELNU|nr:PREDICTED: rust resistance kinase Lr10-like [Nelumbo nucifera]
MASSIALLCSIVLLLNPIFSRSQNDSFYYESCAPYRHRCGNITFTFPFSSQKQFGNSRLDCGLPPYIFTCDSSDAAGLLLSKRSYQVKAIFPSDNLITVADQQLVNDLRSGSCESFQNFTVADVKPLEFPGWGPMLNFFKCQSGINGLPEAFLEQQVLSYSCGENSMLYLFNDTTTFDYNFTRQSNPIDIPKPCTLVRFPVSGANLSRSKLLNKSSSHPETLFQVLSDGFQLLWPKFGECDDCKQAGGRCGYDASLREGNQSSKGIVCFCRGGCDKKTDHKHKRHNPRRWILILGVTVGSVFLLLVLAMMIVITFKYKREGLVNFKISHFRGKRSFGRGQNVEQFIKNYQSTLTTKYSYADIKKITNGFREKLGEGGYGSVFKGKLSNGQLVAVKMLEKYRDNGQDFINEVATIGTIHHVNVINLLGFCWDWEGTRRALVYEFMPNGSLGDLICKEEVSRSLGWAKLLQIAMGIAHGIEYLHNGCEFRILHLDIKPHNILLDHNFQPKISDFGLAKTYSRSDSVVPLTMARGTVGYIAPELFLKNLGGASRKSDVYSYGMLLLEMVGGRKNVHPDIKTSSEAYFPGWIYNKLVQEEDMNLIDMVVEEEVYIVRKMVMVGLWCIQINPRDRPSMTRVIEMLSGRMEAIELPPKPCLFSPPRLQPEQEISSFHSDISILPLTPNSL